MTFDVEVAGRAERTLRQLLNAHVGESAIESRGGTLVLTVPDQAALVSLVAYLNDIGIAIEQVRRAADEERDGP
jgi:hypothetical protein